ncbi:hypothetical protein ACWHAM_09710 [Paenibacillus terrae]
MTKHWIPTFFFINKMDRIGEEAGRTEADIRQQLTGEVCCNTHMKLAMKKSGDVLKKWITYIYPTFRERKKLISNLQVNFKRNLWYARIE